jgi:hypothetical protein
VKMPNFFIPGGPRCGTTAMYTYLEAHPNIYMSEIKEVHFFSDDLPMLKPYDINSLDDYLALYSKAGDEHIALGDASPAYLYSKVALENIQKINKTAKFVVMVRNPIDVAYSFHTINLNLLREDEHDFRKAWQLQEDRENGRALPKHCLWPELLLYGKIPLFGDQVEKLFSLFPRDQIKIIVFDDYAASPQSSYEEVLSFLDVPSDGKTSFPKINQNFGNKINWLSFLTNYPPHNIDLKIRKLISLLGVNVRLVARIVSQIRKFNTKKVERNPLDNETRLMLADYFREDVHKLSHYLDRDLSHWLEIK